MNDSCPRTCRVIRTCCADLRPSGRSVPNDSGHAVEVGVPAGQSDQLLALHGGDQNGIVRQETVLLAQIRSLDHMLLGYRDNTQAEPLNLRQRLAEAVELLKVLRGPNKTGTGTSQMPNFVSCG